MKKNSLAMEKAAAKKIDLSEDILRLHHVLSSKRTKSIGLHP